jgi:GNAT superfamily N-acetyltransferase
MIREPILSDPYNPQREKEPDQKLMRLYQHNFKTVGRDLARFGHGGFFCLDWNFWDGLPLNGLLILRTIFVMPGLRGRGCQRAIINTVESMARKTGCMILAVAHTFKMRFGDPETEEDFIEEYCCSRIEPLEFYGPNDPENTRQNAAFRRAKWVNVDVTENLGTDWITPQMCWVYIPETASSELIQEIKPRLVEPAAALG